MGNLVQEINNTKRLVNEQYGEVSDSFNEHHMMSKEQQIEFIKDNINKLKDDEIEYVYNHIKARLGVKEEGLDPDPSLDPVGKADADIDNDGDVDASDEYLHHRRDVISKDIDKK